MAELSTLGAVIKTAYEGQANTNAFTDAEKAKLAEVIANAIESAAGLTLKLGDAAGAFSLGILDSGDVVVASIDSDGNIVTLGNLYGNDDTASFAVAAYTSPSASMSLFGSTHATNANDIQFTNGVDDVLTYDDSADTWDLHDKNLTLGGILTLDTGVAVASLPGVPAVGMIARVTDANAPSIGSTVAGGGAAAALVWYNGTNWTVIGV